MTMTAERPRTESPAPLGLTLGMQLWQRMNAMRLSEKELAQRSGVPLHEVNCILMDVMVDDYPDLVRKVCAALGLYREAGIDPALVEASWAKLKESPLRKLMAECGIPTVVDLATATRNSHPPLYRARAGTCRIPNKVVKFFAGPGLGYNENEILADQDEFMEYVRNQVVRRIRMSRSATGGGMEGVDAMDATDTPGVSETEETD